MMIFTHTYGRSGTAYLARLLAANTETKSVCVAHEMLRPDDWGLRTPDLSTMTRYNHLIDVSDFWMDKFDDMMARPEPIKIETSHQLSKGGLLDHIDLCPDKDIKVICLERDWGDIAVSLRQRGDFSNVTLMWLWYLDPRYPRNVTRFDDVPDVPESFRLFFWYLMEQKARQKRYRELLGDRVDFIDVRLEDIATVAGARVLLRRLGLERKADIMIPPPGTRNEGPPAFVSDRRDARIAGSRICDQLQYGH